MRRHAAAMVAACLPAMGVLCAIAARGTPVPPLRPLSTAQVPTVTPLAMAAPQITPLGVAARAERIFFEALNRRPESRPEAVNALQEALSAEPSSGQLNLWLGLSHLWITAESRADSPETIEHAILAEHYLVVAGRLMPEDDRIVSWLAPVRILLAERSGDKKAVEQGWAEMRAAVHRDPCFHAVAMAILCFDKPADSREFGEGLDALRRAAACGSDDPSVQNRERWPHNLEGFALALAQYELKAGNRQRAETMLMFAQERPSYPAWPHRALLEAMLANIDRTSGVKGESALVIAPGSAVACRICHQGQ